MLTTEQVLNFKRDGYLVLPGFATASFCDSIVELARAELSQNIEPQEYETDTHYPGAPASRSAPGGNTARRLLNAIERFPTLAEWAKNEELCEILRKFLGDTIHLSQAHHNCVMTKQPEYSSMTGWHRDSRYWSFAKPELISAWLALNGEFPENGGLWVLPGSHKWEMDAYQFDDKEFLRTDYAKNIDLLERATAVTLEQGDLLLFHSNLFHAAGRNTTTETKYSAVFTYRADDNEPKWATRTLSKAEIKL